MVVRVTFGLWASRRAADSPRWVGRHEVAQQISVMPFRLLVARHNATLGSNPTAGYYHGLSEGK